MLSIIYENQRKKANEIPNERDIVFVSSLLCRKLVNPQGSQYSPLTVRRTQITRGY